MAVPPDDQGNSPRRLERLLCDYARRVASTDELPRDEIQPIAFGLFGEVGSLLAAVKKRRREDAAYTQYDKAIVEELGDVLWYLCALSRRVDVAIADMANLEAPSLPRACADVESVLAALGAAVGDLLRSEVSRDWRTSLRQVFGLWLAAVEATTANTTAIVRNNEEKVLGRFRAPVMADLPTFDSQFAESEQLPHEFEIDIVQSNDREVRLRWNRVFIGDSLTDNVADADGYRFHDVFHMAHAAVLHWSPVFRSLIKQKRKSDAEIDENEDGGRAIAVEEGLTAWIFSEAKQRDHFSGRQMLSFGMLKTVQQFVREFEVSQCPLYLWERAILEGYTVFRNVRDCGGGIVLGDRTKRTINFKPR